MIHIKNLRMRTIIGAFDWEREIRHNLCMNIKVGFDVSKAASSDNLDDTINYHDLSNDIIEKVEASEFYLVEKLADYVLKLTLGYAHVKWAEIEIDKPDALRYAESVSVKVRGEN